jgi:transposase-like protein
VDDLGSFCCLNPDCKDHGRRGSGNLRVHSRTGLTKQYRILLCRTCGARSSERKGTPLFRSHLPDEKVVSILEHLNEGSGVRQTERLVKVHRDTVMRYGRLAGRHSKQAHDELVAISPGDPRGPIRREMVVRRQEAGALRPRRPGR